MKYIILDATENDKEEILSLYKKQIGREFCPWNEHYPTMEEIDFDLSKVNTSLINSSVPINSSI